MCRTFISRKIEDDKVENTIIDYLYSCQIVEPNNSVANISDLSDLSNILSLVEKIIEIKETIKPKEDFVDNLRESLNMDEY